MANFNSNLSLNNENLGRILDAINALPDVEDISPSGEIEITENGTHDVSEYASAKVNVKAEGDNKLVQVVDGTATEITAEDLAGATKIRDFAFYRNAVITNVIIPNSVTSIGDYAFEDCTSLKNAPLPSGITSIGEKAFSNCRMASISIPSSITSLGAAAFERNTKLESVHIAEGATLGHSLFQYCTALKSVVLPNSLLTVAGYMFSYCSALESVTLPNAVTVLHNNAFASCYKLKCIVIPSTLTQIAGDAFRSCKALEYVDLTAYGTGTTFPILANVSSFSNAGTETTKGTFEIRVPVGRKAELSAMTNWSSFADNIVEV
jgi:hypothetical protein